ncbi:glucose-1-phosphate cytidylyltransferase [bacterium]|nr:glucose-1-phosphate cytidylyltransferase [bacterium]MBU4510889.1 glucose-1-phosphate cytidylyltransferase [bacterium]
MKVVILAGGFGTRLSEETDFIPKPMVEIGGHPIIWHIMKLYSTYGYNDFLVCLGYKGYLIKEYFANYFLHMSDVTFNLKTGEMVLQRSNSEDWQVTLVDTGLNTMTGGRIKRIKKFIGNNTFLFTYGDGVSDVNIQFLVNFHKKNHKYATLTAVQPPGKFGSLSLDNSGKLKKFTEKPAGDGSWINGGFFVLEPEIFNYIEGDNTFWEREPLENLAKDKQLIAYKHNNFWKCMDTLRDKRELEELWKSGNAPWKVWK